MQNVHTPRRTLTHRPATAQAGWGRLVKRALDWIAAADHAYRQRQHMQRLSDAQIKDAGVTRAAMNNGGR
ncbi:MULTISPECIES: hypothetical protein [unclassified Marinovum]